MALTDLKSDLSKFRIPFKQKSIEETQGKHTNVVYPTSELDSTLINDKVDKVAKISVPKSTPEKIGFKAEKIKEKIGLESQPLPSISKISSVNTLESQPLPSISKISFVNNNLSQNLKINGLSEAGRYAESNIDINKIESNFSNQSPIVGMGKSNTSQVLQSKFSNQSPIVGTGKSDLNESLESKFSNQSPIIKADKSIVGTDKSNQSPIVGTGKSNQSLGVGKGKSNQSPIVGTGKSGLNESLESKFSDQTGPKKMSLESKFLGQTTPNKMSLESKFLGQTEPTIVDVSEKFKGETEPTIVDASEKFKGETEPTNFNFSPNFITIEPNKFNTILDKDSQAITPTPVDFFSNTDSVGFTPNVREMKTDFVDAQTANTFSERIKNSKLKTVNFFSNEDAVGFTKNFNPGSKSQFTGISFNGEKFKSNKPTTKLGVVNFFPNDDAQGFTENFDRATPSQFRGISFNGEKFKSNKPTTKLGLVNFFPNDDAQGFTKNFVDKTKSQFTGISIDGEKFISPKVTFSGDFGLSFLPGNKIKLAGSAAKYYQIGSQKWKPGGKRYEDEYISIGDLVIRQGEVFLKNKNSPSYLKSVYSQFNLQDDSFNPYPVFFRQPFILRGIQRKGNSKKEPQKWGFGGAVDSIMGVDLIRGGVLTSTERALIDVARIGKFVLSPKGIVWSIKQVGLQKTNTHNKVWTPINLLLAVGGQHIGLEPKRHGLLPFGPDEGNYQIFPQKSDEKYKDKLEGFRKSIDVLKLLGKGFSKIELKKQSGGPDSTYGIGMSNINTSTNTFSNPEKTYGDTKAKFIQKYNPIFENPISAQIGSPPPRDTKDTIKNTYGNEFGVGTNNISFSRNVQNDDWWKKLGLLNSDNLWKQFGSALNYDNFGNSRYTNTTGKTNTHFTQKDHPFNEDLFATEIQNSYGKKFGVGTNNISFSKNLENDTWWKRIGLLNSDKSWKEFSTTLNTDNFGNSRYTNEKGNKNTHFNQKYHPFEYSFSVIEIQNSYGKKFGVGTNNISFSRNVQNDTWWKTIGLLNSDNLWKQFGPALNYDNFKNSRFTNTTGKTNTHFNQKYHPFNEDLFATEIQNSYGKKFGLITNTRQEDLKKLGLLNKIIEINSTSKNFLNTDNFGNLRTKYTTGDTNTFWTQKYSSILDKSGKVINFGFAVGDKGTKTYGDEFSVGTKNSSFSRDVKTDFWWKKIGLLSPDNLKKQFKGPLNKDNFGNLRHTNINFTQKYRPFEVNLFLPELVTYGKFFGVTSGNVGSVYDTTLGLAAKSYDEVTPKLKPQSGYEQLWEGNKYESGKLKTEEGEEVLNYNIIKELANGTITKTSHNDFRTKYKTKKSELQKQIKDYGDDYYTTTNIKTRVGLGNSDTTIGKSTQGLDLIHLTFTTNNKKIQFRGTVNSISETYSPTWTEIKYSGRAENAYIYDTFGRELNFGFRVYAYSVGELKPMWERLEELGKMTMPSYVSGNGYHGNITKFRLGTMYQDFPVLISSLQYAVPDEFTWEIGLNKGSDGNELPMGVDVTIGLKLLGNNLHKSDATKIYSYK